MTIDRRDFIKTAAAGAAVSQLPIVAALAEKHPQASPEGDTTAIQVECRHTSGYLDDGFWISQGLTLTRPLILQHPPKPGYPYHAVGKIPIGIGITDPESALAESITLMSKANLFKMYVIVESDTFRDAGTYFSGRISFKNKSISSRALNLTPRRKYGSINFYEGRFTADVYMHGAATKDEFDGRFPS